MSLWGSGVTEAPCPAGEIVIGGGCQVFYFDDPIVACQPSDSGPGWQVASGNVRRVSAICIAP